MKPINTNYFRASTWQRFTRDFLLLFYILAAYKWFNGQFMYQLQPHFFNNRFDPVAWLLMETGIHQWLLNNRPGWILFDLAFYTMPLLWWLSWKRNGYGISTAQPTRTKKDYLVNCVIVAVWLAVNWVYVQCYTLFPSNSIEGHAAWLLMPFLFAARNLKSFYFLMHGLRYYFLFFLASAAIWKFRQGGFFNIEQMSGILLYQHKEYLVNAPAHWYTQFIYAIVRHPVAGWVIYAAGTLLEFSFAVGFFTKRYDRWLFAGFIIFLLLDMAIMRIPYFELLPLSLPLLFSGYRQPPEIFSEQ
jgi:hypothetical protein